MTILFTQDFDIFPGKEGEYENFIAAYIPQCDRMGLQSVGGFYVEVGFGPRIIFLGKPNSLDDLYHVMAGTPFKESLLELKKYVINYQSKILEPTGRVKHESYEIQKKVFGKTTNTTILSRARKRNMRILSLTNTCPTLAEDRLLGGHRGVECGGRRVQ